jgi:uncharacterized protein
MNVVSNTSPLIGLARIGRLDLLKALYGALTIPEAVWQEVVVAGADQPGADQVKDADWIQTRGVTNRQLVRALQQELDAGEAEAIALALEVEADLLLMDERLGRNTAHHLGLKYIGSLGVLIEAKHKSLINAVKPELNSLRDAAGFRISERLYARVLQDEGEA